MKTIVMLMLISSIYFAQTLGLTTNDLGSNETKSTKIKKDVTKVVETDHNFILRYDKTTKVADNYPECLERIPKFQETIYDDNKSKVIPFGAETEQEIKDEITRKKLKDKDGNLIVFE